MLRLEQIVVVEGRHDAAALAMVLDATIIETNGFGIFRDKELSHTLKSLAQKRGIIIMTDSDRAGFAIRDHLVNVIGGEYITHVYIPDIYGKERRKSKPSKEGKLGVEGMSGEVILDALNRAGITSSTHFNDKFLTKTDFYFAGLSGTPDSSQRRDKIKKYLNLPQNLSSNKLLDVLNIMLDRRQFKKIMGEIMEDNLNV